MFLKRRWHTLHSTGRPDSDGQLSDESALPPTPFPAVHFTLLDFFVLLDPCINSISFPYHFLIISHSIAQFILWDSFEIPFEIPFEDPWPFFQIIFRDTLGFLWRCFGILSRFLRIPLGFFGIFRDSFEMF